MIIEITKSLAAQAEQGKNVCEKGPVMLLHEIFNDVQFDCLSSDGPQHSKFKVQAMVTNKKFEGTGKRFYFCKTVFMFTGSKLGKIFTGRHGNFRILLVKAIENVHWVKVKDNCFHRG